MVLDCDQVAAPVIQKSGVQGLVQVGHQLAEKGECLPAPFRFQAGVGQFVRVAENTLGHAKAVRTVPFLFILLAVSRYVDVMQGGAPGPAFLRAHPVGPVAGEIDRIGQAFGWGVREDFLDPDPCFGCQHAGCGLTDQAVTLRPPGLRKGRCHQQACKQCCVKKSFKSHPDRSVL